MANIKIKNINKRFGDVIANEDISLSVKDGELICLLGPSGCGKTTLLRVLAGFITPDKGEVFVDESNITKLPPEKRPSSMVFQNYALFPHKNVFENIAFGLKLLNEPLSEIKNKVTNILDIVGLEKLENRAIKELSGGQQQRVALARALVMNPKILLLDEPLSNLDAKLRIAMRNHLKKIQDELGITTLYVTHDQDEALSLADRVAVMNKGKIVQVDTPYNIYNKPESLFVADFIGDINILEVVDYDNNGLIKLNTGDEILIDSEKDINKDSKVVIRPEYLDLVYEKNEDKNVSYIYGKINSIDYLGNIIYYHVKIGSKDANNFELVVSNYGLNITKFSIGDEVFIEWPNEKGYIINE